VRIYFKRGGTCAFIFCAVRFSLAHIYLKEVARMKRITDLFFKNYCIKKYGGIYFLFSFCGGFTVSRLLFVVISGFFRNFFIYKGLNYIKKRSYLDVERLSYAD